MFQFNFLLFILLTKSIISQNICDLEICECELETYYIKCNITDSSLELEISNNEKETNFQIDTLVINFKANNLKKLPNGLLNNLDIYLLSIRNQTHLEYDLSLLKSVKTLSLSNNNLTDFNYDTYSIDLMQSIEYLILNNNRIRNISNLKEFVNLNEIDLSSNKISEINIEDLLNLDTLILTSNRINKIDFKSDSLTRLAIDNNQLVSLDNIFNFKNLNYLQLSKNSIKIIKNNTLNLSNLIELDLSKNEINTIEESSFIHLTKLKLLDLSYNYLNKISVELFKNMPHLEKLYLQSNRIKLFSLNYLKNLFILDLSNNQLKQIDYELHDYNKLSIVRLSNNSLTSVKFLEYLPSIQFIYLDNNYLNEIYNDVSNLIKMDYSNQNGRLTILPNYVFKKLKTNQVLLTLNLALNSDLKFSQKSFCYNNTDSKYQKSFLDIYLSNQTVVNAERCIFKQIGRIFKRVRLFVTGLNDLNANDFICKCDFRLFLSFYNVIIKNKCPRFSTYCFNEQFSDNCGEKKEFSCLENSD